jgi:hypothetical protein
VCFFLISSLCFPIEVVLALLPPTHSLVHVWWQVDDAGIWKEGKRGDEELRGRLPQFFLFSLALSAGRLSKVPLLYLLVAAFVSFQQACLCRFFDVALSLSLGALSLSLSLSLSLCHLTRSLVFACLFLRVGRRRRASTTSVVDWLGHSNRHWEVKTLANISLSLSLTLSLSLSLSVSPPQTHARGLVRCKICLDYSM